MHLHFIQKLHSKILRKSKNIGFVRVTIVAYQIIITLVVVKGSTIINRSLYLLH